MTALISRAIDAVNAEQLPLDEPIGWVIYAAMFVGIVVSPLVVVLGVRTFRQGYQMFSSDPVDAAEVYDLDGVVEVEGVARELEGTTSTEYSNEPALVHRYRRERKQEKTDDDGNTTTEWKRVKKGSDGVPFLVEDDSGSVVVDPTDARLSLTVKQVRRGGRYEMGENNRRHRDYEGYIAPGDEVYVYGQTQFGAGGGGDNEVYIGDGGDVAEFVISDGSELRTVFRYLGKGAFLSLMGLAMMVVALIVFLAMTDALFGLPFVLMFPLVW